jgi:rod shape-determining protein MreC
MDFLNKHKKFFIIGMTVLCLVVIVVTTNLDNKPAFLQNVLGFVVTPVQSVISSVGYWVQEKVEFFSEMSNFQQENKRLVKENADLRAENTRLQLAEEENKTYANLFKLKEQYGDYPTVGARIISKNSVDWYHTYTIDKGIKDGLQTDMAVLAPGGLAGRITECYYNRSVILSILDDRSVVTAAKLFHSQDSFSVRGDVSLMQQGVCRMERIFLDVQLSVGEEVVTSLLSRYYPSGITIGTVSEIVSDPNGLTKHAIIRPAVSFNHLESVLVVTELINHETEDEDSQIAENP